MSDLTLLLAATRYASEMHRLQRRKGDGVGPANLKTPYINHPIAVAAEISRAGLTDVNVLCAALLHDTIEDTEATEFDLRMVFGDEITEIVLEVTDDKSLPKARRKELQIEHAPHISVAARHVKLADKISNVRDLLTDAPPDWPVERVREYFDWAKRVVDCIRGTNEILESTFDDIYTQKP